MGPGKASDNAYRLQEPWLACPDWEAFDDKEKRSVHRVFDVKGGTHCCIFQCSEAGQWAGLSCTKAPCAIEPQFIDFESEQSLRLWTLSATPEALSLGLSSLRITTHKNSIALQLVITSALSRGGFIMKLMKRVLQSLFLHQPLPSPEGGPRAVVEAERTLQSLLPHCVFFLPIACGKL